MRPKHYQAHDQQLVDDKLKSSVELMRPKEFGSNDFKKISFMRGLKILTPEEFKMTKYVNSWKPEKSFPSNIQSVQDRKDFLTQLMMPFNSNTISKLLLKTPNAYLATEKDVLKSWQKNEDKLSASTNGFWPSNDFKKLVMTDPKLYKKPQDMKPSNPIRYQAWLRNTAGNKQLKELEEKEAKKKRDIVSKIKADHRELEKKILQTRALMVQIDKKKALDIFPQLSDASHVENHHIQIIRCLKCYSYVRLASFHPHHCRLEDRDANISYFDGVQDSEETSTLDRKETCQAVLKMVDRLIDGPKEVEKIVPAMNGRNDEPAKKGISKRVIEVVFDDNESYGDSLSDTGKGSWEVCNLQADLELNQMEP